MKEYKIWFRKTRLKKKKESILIQVTLMRNLSKRFSEFNPLAPTSDLHVTSPCNIHTLPDRQVKRILKLLRQKLS